MKNKNQLCRYCKNRLTYDYSHTCMDYTNRIVKNFDVCMFGINIEQIEILKCSQFK